MGEIPHPIYNWQRVRVMNKWIDYNLNKYDRT